MREIDRESELNDILKKAENKVVAVYFKASWCGPCKIIGPVYEKLAKDDTYKNTIIFIKCDVDEADELAECIGIECMPTIVFYKNKEKVDTMSGANKAKLTEKIQELHDGCQSGCQSKQ